MKEAPLQMTVIHRHVLPSLQLMSITIMRLLVKLAAIRRPIFLSHSLDDGSSEYFAI